jgi:molybdenum cofactor cytidylyltransferase
MQSVNHDIAALILAAGMSRRMGSPKMVLPWKDTTVIGQVVKTITSAGIQEQYVVVGGDADKVDHALKAYPIHLVTNPNYASGEMVQSVRAGLQNLPAYIQSALIVLGDQPQIEVDTITAIINVYRETDSPLVVPSYQYKRGHPWLVKRALWQQIINLRPEETLRNFFKNNIDDIQYVLVTTPTILSDLDTPEDYKRQKPD